MSTKASGKPPTTPPTTPPATPPSTPPATPPSIPRSIPSSSGAGAGIALGAAGTGIGAGLPFTSGRSPSSRPHTTVAAANAITAARPVAPASCSPLRVIAPSRCSLVPAEGDRDPEGECDLAVDVEAQQHPPGIPRLGLLLHRVITRALDVA